MAFIDIVLFLLETATSTGGMCRRGARGSTTMPPSKIVCDPTLLGA
jgi:hypothetical protein